MGVDVLVFGATRNTGLAFARLAAGCGMTVAAMARAGSDTAALKAMGAAVLAGDAFVLSDCAAAFAAAAPRFAVSFMGGKDKTGRRVCDVGNINVVKAATGAAPAVARFVLVTSMGCGEQYAATSEQVKRFLGEALLAKTRAEDFLRETDLAWSIVRPGGLTNDPATGDYAILDAPDASRSGYLPRADVARAVMDVLKDGKYRHAVLSVQGAKKPVEGQHA